MTHETSAFQPYFIKLFWALESTEYLVLTAILLQQKVVVLNRQFPGIAPRRGAPVTRFPGKKKTRGLLSMVRRSGLFGLTSLSSLKGRCKRKDSYALGTWPLG